MTIKTKILTGAYTAGYDLSQAYGALSITASGSVTGRPGIAGARGVQPSMGGPGVDLPYPATLTNRGNVTGGVGGAGLYYEGRYIYHAAPGGVGVYDGGGGPVINYGSITGGAGSNLGLGGTGVLLQFAGALTNLGTISGGQAGPGYEGAAAGQGGAGVVEKAGSRVVNDGLILGGTGGHAGDGGTGLVMTGAATVTNLGTIHAGSAVTGITGYGLSVVGGGVVVNGSAADRSALIAGKIGVLVNTQSPTTITNFGTVDGTSGVAVNFHYNGDLYFDRLAVEAGSNMIGAVKGGYAALEIGAATGTLSGLGAGTLGGPEGTVSGGISMTFSGFGAYVIDAGGVWTLAGDNVVRGNSHMINGGVLNEQSGALTVYRTLVNQGSIIGAAHGYALDLGLRGLLVNGAPGATTASVSGFAGVYCNCMPYLAVQNYGTITAITNGISIASAGVTVINQGTIRGATGTLHGAYCGVGDAGGAIIVNGAAGETSALISGVIGVVGDGHSATTVTNYGTIQGSGGVAVQLTGAQGRLVEWAGGKLIGSVQGGGGTLEFAGVGGTVSGFGQAASFSGFTRYYFNLNSAWTLAGLDTLTAADTLTNGGALLLSGTMTNSGRIIGRIGSPGTNGLAHAGYIGVALTGAGRIFNHGVIAGGEGSESLYGVYGNGVSFPGGAGGVGVSIAGVSAGYEAANYGTITGGAGHAGSRAIFKTNDIGGAGGAGGAGVSLSGARLANSGIISGGVGGAGALGYPTGGAGGAGGAGVQIAGGTIANTGTILGAAGGGGGKGQTHWGAGGAGGDGVALTGAGVVINGGTAALAPGALISGLVGVYAGVGATATVINFGTIAGSRGVAVQFEASADRLIEQAGDAFIGVVEGGGGTLELGSPGGAGSITGLGSAFTGFGTYAVDSGATWTLTGANSALQGGQSLVDSGHLTIQATVNNGGLIEASGGGYLTFLGGRVTGPGEVLAQNASVVVMDGAYVQGGTLGSAGTGKIELIGGANVFDGSEPIALSGQALLLNGSSVAAAGALTGGGRLWIAGSSLATQLTIGASLTISGGGSIYLGGGADDEIVGEGGSMINVSDTIYGAGVVNGSMNLDNQAHGVILADTAAGILIDIGSGSFSNEGLIEADGRALTIEGALTNAGRLSAFKGVLTVTGAITGAGSDNIGGGTLIAQGALSQHVQFIGGSGELELAQSQAFAGRISGFSKTGGTSLDLRDIAFASPTEATYSGTAARGVLSVADGSHTTRINLTGDYLSSTFTASSDGHGGTVVVAAATGGTTPNAFVAAMAAIGQTDASPAAALAPATHYSIPRLAGPVH